MSIMFEVYYRPPEDSNREAKITERVSRLGGRLSFREGTNSGASVCLTYEFDRFAEAKQAADMLRQFGEHVEGPMEYAG